MGSSQQRGKLILYKALAMGFHSGMVSLHECSLLFISHRVASLGMGCCRCVLSFAFCNLRPLARPTASRYVGSCTTNFVFQVYTFLFLILKFRISVSSRHVNQRLGWGQY